MFQVLSQGGKIFGFNSHAGLWDYILKYAGLLDLSKGELDKCLAVYWIVRGTCPLAFPHQDRPGEVASSSAAHLLLLRRTWIPGTHTVAHDFACDSSSRDLMPSFRARWTHSALVYMWANTHTHTIKIGHLKN